MSRRLRFRSAICALAACSALAACASAAQPAATDPQASAAIPIGSLKIAAPAPGAASTAIACFVPGQDCQGLIAAAIAAARSQILMQAYDFTSVPIADALVAAARRGVTVRVLLDRADLTLRGSRLPELAAAGVPVAIDSIRGIAHNKVIIIDGKSVITGSFNFTHAAATRNAENVVLIRDPAVVPLYAANWRRRAAASLPVLAL